MRINITDNTRKKSSIHDLAVGDAVRGVAGVIYLKVNPVQYLVITATGIVIGLVSGATMEELPRVERNTQIVITVE